MRSMKYIGKATTAATPITTSSTATKSNNIVCRVRYINLF